MSIERYSVTWADATGTAHYNTVIVEEGYTTLDDIPKMLAVAAGLPVSDVRVDKVSPAGTQYRRQFPLVWPTGRAKS